MLDMTRDLGYLKEADPLSAAKQLRIEASQLTPSELDIYAGDILTRAEAQRFDGIPTYLGIIRSMIGEAYATAAVRAIGMSEKYNDPSWRQSYLDDALGCLKSAVAFGCKKDEIVCNKINTIKKTLQNHKKTAETS